jgi:hypothetical protein
MHSWRRVTQRPSLSMFVHIPLDRLVKQNPPFGGFRRDRSSPGLESKAARSALASA